MVINMMHNKDFFVCQLSLLIGTFLQTAAWLTIVSNFGWTHPASIMSYIVSVLIYFVVYILWKQK